MISPVKSALLVALLAPVFSLAHAQSNDSSVTRAQVKQELADIESAGYKPTDWLHYPENAQAAERRLQARRVQQGVQH
jgi:outer membrane lipoprotein-sorting protein